MNTLEQVIIYDEAAQAAARDFVAAVQGIFTVDTATAAKLLGMSQYRFRKLGIPSIQTSANHRRYTISALSEWVKNNTENHK